MKSLQLFNYDNHQVRVVGTPENPLFVAKDLSDLLGYGQTTKALKLIDEDEKLRCLISTSGQKRNALCVTESGLWCLIIRSRKPEAKKIRKWVTSEVLPAIRQTGRYEIDKTPNTPTSPKSFLIWDEFARDNFELNLLRISDATERENAYVGFKKFWNTVKLFHGDTTFTQIKTVKTI